MNDCVAKLREAMATRKMVVLHKYASPHSNTVTDRIVEPYQLMNDERDVRCHEIAVAHRVGGDNRRAVGV